MRVLFLLLLSGCSLGSGLSGHGMDDLSSLEGPLTVVATHTRVARGEGKAFGDHVEAIKLQMESHPGFVGQALRTRLPGRERWTLSVWESEEDLMEFAFGEGAHLEAMSDAGTVIDGVYTASWEVEPSELPISWSTALEHLELERSTPPWD